MTNKTDTLVELAWQELLDKDDRTSPAEYPDMVLVTRDEVAAIIVAALQSVEVTEALVEEIESAMNQFRHCQRQGPWWFTNGEPALRATTDRWLDKVDAAIATLKSRFALGEP